MESRIEDYALLGDCRTAALVSRNGSVDWLCWPRFDSDACFAALLGTPENGRWRIAPRDKPTKTTRRYRPHTMILETVVETASGRYRLIEFMAPGIEHSTLVRIAVGEAGQVELDAQIVLRYDYGECTPWISVLPDGAIEAVSGPDMAVLRTPLEMERHDATLTARFTLREGEIIPFVLAYNRSHLPPAPALDAQEALAATQRWWEEWCGTGDVGGEYGEIIERSLLTLKALTYAPTGGIVAAPTTSLPERIGGERNWDYRYCWLRDATLTMLALMNARHFDEAKAWRDWLVRAAAGAPQQLQILYGLAGERRITEWEVDWLPGHMGSRPVRIGNAAHTQVQVDVYGEVMDALYQARCAGIAASDSAWALQCSLLEYLESIWEQPDEGIWEVRGGAQHFTYSKIMAWLAFDRGVKSCEEFGLKGDLARWRELRDRIKREVCERGYDSQLGTFVQCYGSKLLDAALLQIPMLGFLPCTDERVQGTVRAIERGLMWNGLVLRYRTDLTKDGLAPGEGAFLACSFWLADVYVMMGRMDEARALFERLCVLANDVGLLAEEYDPVARRQLGNFPQAFSHISLLNTAHNLSRARKPAEQRSERTPTGDRGYTSQDAG